MHEKLNYLKQIKVPGR